MRYTIKVLKRAERYLAALPKKDLKKIARRIDALADDPRPSGAKLLKGSLSGHYLIRSGDYRIVYKIENKILVIVIVSIGHRKEIYRKG